MRARIAGTQLSYDVRGAGPALLLLHAFPLNLQMWDAQVALLASSHTVVRFDDRGFGGSPPGDAMLSMERIADDAAALLDHLGISKAVVVGCSMGGYAAFAMLRRHADRIRALVLQDTRAGADSEEARANRALLAEKVLKQGAQAALEVFLPRLVGETTHRERADVVAWLRETILATPARGIADALAGLGARADSNPTLREISVPTLIVCGAEDVLTPPADSEAMQRAIPGSRLEIIPKAGHLANLENPEACNAVLRAFLSPLARPA
jgi:pimeloyl-ACP methyl ester carboxylesterase